MAVNDRVVKIKTHALKDSRATDEYVPAISVNGFVVWRGNRFFVSMEKALLEAEGELVKVFKRLLDFKEW